MSEPIPEAIPTSADRRSHRPTKKRALTPSSAQSAEVEALFANPDREITIPEGGPKTKTVAAPPEIVANVQGSSAGAGSGEFHVYKASRRREYERLRVMDDEVEREEKEREFRARREEMRSKDEEKLSKNQAKRAKMKARKEKKKLDPMEVDGNVEGEMTNGRSVKKKLGPAKVALPNGVDADAADGIETAANGQVADEGGGIRFHDD